MLAEAIGVSRFGKATSVWALAAGLFVVGQTELGLDAQEYPSETTNTHAAARTQAGQWHGTLSLSFEPNRGQAVPQVKFLARGPNHAWFLTPGEAVLAMGKAAAPSLQEADTQIASEAVLRLQVVGGNRESLLQGLDELPGTVNYFVGNDPGRWRTNVPTYASVRCEAVYPGVDLVFHANRRQLEYDFVLGPGADPGVITLGFPGAGAVELDEQGDLVIRTAGGELRQPRPLIYQEVAGGHQVVSGGYVLRDHQQVGFVIGAHDADRALVIDPVLVYSTYFGGGGEDSGNGIAVDAEGNTYVTGTSGGQFYVTKLNPTGSTAVYTTNLGGSGVDNAFAIAVDRASNAYVVGQTQSANFPTVNPLQPTLKGGQDAFVTKLDPSGSALVYSTYLGGSQGEGANGVAVDRFGAAYVAGWTHSNDFPLHDPLQPTRKGGLDAFITKLDPSGSALVYSTYLGGSSIAAGASDDNFIDDNVAHAIAVDIEGNAYVAGHTRSPTFPTTTSSDPLLSRGYGGGNCPFFNATVPCPDAFVAKLNSLGSALIYCAYLGGNGDDQGFGIAVDSRGTAYVTGQTGSSNFPTAGFELQPHPQPHPHRPPPLQASSAGGLDAFVAAVNPSGSELVYSTYLGGGGRDTGFGIAVDARGDVYVTGETSSTNFPTKKALQPVLAGTEDAFVAKLNAAGSRLIYSTYLGGSSDGTFGELGAAIAVDQANNAYLTGTTQASDFPTKNAFQPAFGGGLDAFIAKIYDQPADLSITKKGPPIPVPVGGNVSYAIKVTNLGPESATGVTIIDTLPRAVTFVSASPGCVVKPHPMPLPVRPPIRVFCSLGSLANGASAAVNIVVKTTAVGLITNKARVSGNEIDPNPANDLVAVGTNVTPPIQAPSSKPL